MTSKAIKSYLPDYLLASAAFCLMIWNASRLGIWEPWEAEAASIVRNMLNSGKFLMVNVATSDAPEQLANLPFGWWPQVLSSWLLGETELALRLPNVVVCCGTIGAIYWVAQPLFGTTSARLSVLIALCTPLLVFNGCLALGSMIPQGMTAIACLWILGGQARNWARRWHAHGAWFWVTLAGLTSGIIGVLLPLLVFFTCCNLPRLKGGLRVKSAGPMFISILVVLTGWMLASAYCPKDLPVIQWLWFIDGLAIERKSGFHPAFSLYVHQIGFGLFPWGVLAPLAFGLLIFGRGTSGRMQRYFTAIFVWFGGAFAYGAITYSWTHYALFLGAPALALIVAPFLIRLFEDHASNGLVIITAVLLVALVDSNLKHDPRLLAETFVGGDVETFPASVEYSRWGRYLNFGLLGLLILFGTRILAWTQAVVNNLWFPTVRPHLFSPIQCLTSAISAFTISTVFQRSLLRMSQRLSLGNLMTWVKLLLIGCAIGLVIHLLLHFTWRWRYRCGLAHTKELRLPKFASQHHLAILGLVFVTVGWLCVQQVAVATTLTDNFSQRGLLNQYETYRGLLNNAPIYTYGLTERDRSYYARDLPSIDAKKFTELCQQGTAFFAVIPQKNLAKVNDRFRKQIAPLAKERPKHMPVVYDGGARFYLVASQLPEGANDLNPMKRALLTDESELPPDVNRVDINFENKVKIIGWRIEPKIARRGSPLKIVVYWKVLKSRVGSWKVFVHIDAPGQRIHADHKPVAGLLPTENWRAGDLIADEHTIKISRTKSPANFTFYTGLFRGSARLKVTEGPQDGKNRAKLGRIQLK